MAIPHGVAPTRIVATTFKRRGVDDRNVVRRAIGRVQKPAVGGKPDPVRLALEVYLA
jgi:hypothetical protein